MNIIIVGCGRFGNTLANELSDAGHNVSVVDRNNERLDTLGSGFNGVKVRGIEFDDEILQDAGVGTADALLAVTPDENINITVSLIAKEIYKVPRIIARIVNPNRQYIYEELNIETINPTELGVEILKSRILADQSGVIATICSDYEVAEVAVRKDRHLTVKELEAKFGCIISGIVKDDKFVSPVKDAPVLQGEKIICTICKKNFEKLVSSL